LNGIDRKTDIKTRKEHPDNNPHSYIHLIFDKGTKSYNGEKTASSTNVLEKLVICRQKNETRSMSLALYKYHLKVS
jgi:hypothetical protein